MLDAATATSWGLVSEVAASGTAQQRASSIAAELASGPRHALGQARSLVRGSWEATRAEVGLREAQVIGRAVRTPEASALLARFGRR